VTELAITCDHITMDQSTWLTGLFRL